MMSLLKMNSKGIFFLILNCKLNLSKSSFECCHRQTIVTRVDQDFDIRRVQTQAEKFLPKTETLNRGRKRKAQTSKQKSSSVRWVNFCFYI